MMKIIRNTFLGLLKVGMARYLRFQSGYKKKYKLKGLISLLVIFDFLNRKYGNYDINILNKNYLLKKFIINKS